MKKTNASANTRAQKGNAKTQEGLQVITTAENTAEPKKAKRAAAQKIDFTPARKYTERVREGAAEVQSLNACFRELKRAYNFLEGLQFASFADYMNQRYKNAHKAGKGWSAWYAAQYAEKYIKDAASDKDSTDHETARKYLLAAKLERDADGLRKL